MVKKLGFTVIELLVIISIISILITLATVNLSGAKHKSNYTTALSDMTSIADAAKLYKGEYGVWPADGNGNPGASGEPGTGVLPNTPDPNFRAYLNPYPKPACENAVYDWENWTGKPTTSGIGVTYRFAMSSSDDCNSVPDGEFCLGNAWNNSVPLYYLSIDNLLIGGVIPAWMKPISAVPGSKITCKEVK